MASLISTTCSPLGCRGALRYNISVVRGPCQLFCKAIWPPTANLAQQMPLVMMSSSPGDFFTSELVVQEFSRMYQEYTVLGPLALKFADFDLEGKRIFLQQWEGFVERSQIFQMRLRLAEDAKARGAVHQLNVQLLEASTSLAALFEGMKEQLEDMKSVLEEEERTADPEKQRMIRQGYREMYSTEAKMQVFNMEELMSDPDIMEGMNDPKAMKAMFDIKQDPQAIENYRDRPALYKALRKLFRDI